MSITNKLTGEVYDYKVGSLDERKFIRVMDGLNCGNNEKLFFETEIEYKIYRTISDHKHLEQYKTILISKQDLIKNNWQAFIDWVENPEISTFQL
tara:strand:- start:21 stop:305 length:285 start_codon:yes stop_codon:yes gene_type:complete